MCGQDTALLESNRSSPRTAKAPGVHKRSPFRCSSFPWKPLPTEPLALPAAVGPLGQRSGARIPGPFRVWLLIRSGLPVRHERNSPFVVGCFRWPFHEGKEPFSVKAVPGRKGKPTERIQSVPPAFAASLCFRQERAFLCASGGLLYFGCRAPPGKRKESRFPCKKDRPRGQLLCFRPPGGLREGPVKSGVCWCPLCIRTQQ